MQKITTKIKIISIKEVQERNDPTEKQSVAGILMSCGFAASKVTKKQKEDFLKLDMSEFMRREIEKLDETPTIYVIKEIAEQLGDLYTNAILWHEEGHVVSGHLDGLADFQVDSAKPQILLKEEIELEADAFAATKVGATTLKSALRKVVAVQSKYVACHVGMTRSQYYKMVMNDPLIKLRMERLSA